MTLGCMGVFKGKGKNNFFYLINSSYLFLFKYCMALPGVATYTSIYFISVKIIPIFRFLIIYNGKCIKQVIYKLLNHFLIKISCVFTKH